MPVEQIIIANGKILISPITEQSELTPLLTASDKQYIAGITSGKRRASVSTWRSMLRAEIGDAEIGYNDVGAPVIIPQEPYTAKECRASQDLPSEGCAANSTPTDLCTEIKGNHASECFTVSEDAIASKRESTPAALDIFFNVSHSDDYAAVIISDRKCAIDIERTKRRFDKIESRYISDSERALPQSDNPLFKALLWSAKETLYKFSGRKELNFLTDLIIKAIDFEAGIMAASYLSASGEIADVQVCFFTYGYHNDSLPHRGDKLPKGNTQSDNASVVTYCVGAPTT